MLEEVHAPLVADLFGLGRDATLVGPVASGRLGRIWRLTTNRGRFAVKDSTHPIDRDEVERDAAYQDVVRRHGVPMPAVVRTPDGTVLAEVDGFPVRVYEWVEVLGPERRLDPTEVGRLLASIHTVHVPTDEPVDPWYVDPVGEDSWAELVGRLRDARAPFADRLAALVPDVLAVEALLTAPADRQVCHRDLWADNVLRTPTGDVVVLDWENSGAGSPAQELAVAAFEFGCGDPARIGALYASYVEAGGPGRLEQPSDLTMLIAQTGHIAQIGCERWLSAETDADRADNAAWVGEFLAEPVTVETVRAILRSVNR